MVLDNNNADAHAYREAGFSINVEDRLRHYYGSSVFSAQSAFAIIVSETVPVKLFWQESTAGFLKSDR